MKGLLGSLGYKVVRALSGNEALELLSTRAHLPDLVLLDVEMPSESGYDVGSRFLLRHLCTYEIIFQVCKQLRKQYSEGLPIIMLSANDDEASVLRGLQVSSKQKASCT